MKRANGINTVAHEDRMNAIHEGQMARNALHTIATPIAERQQAVLEKAISQYRAGSLDPQSAYGIIAEMAALYDLREALDSVQRRGITAKMREDAERES